MRMVAIYRGIEEICKDRNKLIDKHKIMFPISVPLEEVSEYVLNYLEKRYNVGELRIYKVIHIYDKFYLVKDIGEIPRRTRKYQKIFTNGLRRLFKRRKN